MTETDLEERRSLVYRFWALWLAVWSAWCEPWDVDL